MLNPFETGQARVRGSIEVICGSMFSGKTEELLRRLRRAKIAGLRVEIFKPSVDTRYADRQLIKPSPLSFRRRRHRHRRGTVLR